MSTPIPYRYPNRCCVCVPLRSGLVAVGCFNLTVDLGLIIIVTHHLLQVYYTHYAHWFPLLEAIISGFTALFYTNDLIFNLLLLYGCYKKDPVKLKVFYWYNIFYVILNMFLVTYFLLELVYSDNVWDIRRLILIITLASWIIYNLSTMYLTSRLIESEEMKLANTQMMGGHRSMENAKDVEQPVLIADESF